MAVGFFKRHSVLLRNNNEKKLDDMKAPPPCAEEGVELVGATFGSVNMTKLAKAMYSYGTTIEVPGFFSDPWMRVGKTFTIVYEVDKGYRAFACKEYQAKANYYSTFRRDFGSSSIATAHHSLASTKKAPGCCPIEIITVFWCPSKRDEQAVIDYLYRCVNNTPACVEQRQLWRE